MSQLMREEHSNLVPVVRECATPVRSDRHRLIMGLSDMGLVSKLPETPLGDLQKGLVQASGGGGAALVERGGRS